MNSFKAVNVQKRFEGVVALKGADFSFEGAKVCGLVGANGSGKTTFARICCGIIQANRGEFFIDGQKVEIASPVDARRYGIVLAHQNLSLIPELTVWQNVRLGHEQKSNPFFLDNRNARRTASRILEELVPGEIPIEAKVVDLSPAQRQLVEVAKALSQEPKLLILDEPTAALEYFHVEQLFKKVEELKRSGTSVVFISHRLWEITRICDQVIAFRNGETVGTVDFEKQAREEELIVPLVTGQAAGEQGDFVKKTRTHFEQA